MRTGDGSDLAAQESLRLLVALRQRAYVQTALAQMTCIMRRTDHRNLFGAQPFCSRFRLHPCFAVMQVMRHMGLGWRNCPRATGDQ